MNTLLLYAVYGLLMFFIIYSQRKCWYFVWQLNGWRGVFQQPLLWLIALISLSPKTFMSSIQRYRKYFQSPQAIIVFNQIFLYVDDPDTMESILTAPECLNKSFLLNGFYANKGLLHAKGEQWKIRRKQLTPVFSQNTLLSFFDTFNHVANKLQVKLFKTLHGSNQVKFKTLDLVISQAVLEVSCLTTMGYETNFLQNDDKGIAEAYKYLMQMSALRTIKFWYQFDFIFCFLDNKNYEKSKRVAKLVGEFVEKIVQQKHIQRQQHKQQHTTNSNYNDMNVSVAIVNKSPKDGTSLYEEEHNHNFSTTTTSTKAAASASLSSSIANDASYNSDTNLLKEQNMTLPLQRQRIFIDQIFYLAQAGKLTLEDIMNESQSMILVSFETVSSFVMNTLLLLAINRECQTELRNEIKQILLLSNDKTNNKKNATTSSINHHNNGTITKGNEKTSKTTSSHTNKTVSSEWLSKMTTNADCKADVNNCNGNNFTHDDDGCDDNRDDIDMQVTMEHLLNMPYLDMIINESLRLLTIVPMNVRSASADFKLNVKQQKGDKYTCTSKTTGKNNNNNNNKTNIKSKHSENCLYRSRGVLVPKDTIFILDVFKMQRNEMYWGKNALKFHPEHFVKKHQKQQQQQHQQEQHEHQQTGKSIKMEENKQADKEQEKENVPTSASALRHSFDFIPFSKGLRNCIGYRYSNYLSKIILINLIASFEFSTNVQLQDLQFEESVSLKFRNADKILFEILPVNCTSADK